MYKEIIRQFKQYNKKEMYQWLIVSAIHPSNQRYIIRYELLIYTLLSIPEDDFSNKSLMKSLFFERLEGDAWVCFIFNFTNIFILFSPFKNRSNIYLLGLKLNIYRVFQE